MQIFVKCFVVLVFQSCFVQQIHSKLCRGNSSVSCMEAKIQNISETRNYNSEQFPSSILYGLSVLAIQSTRGKSISSCVQHLILILEAVKTKEIWAVKSKKSEHDLAFFLRLILKILPTLVLATKMFKVLKKKEVIQVLHENKLVLLLENTFLGRS